MNKNNGFTLVELLSVIVILAIILVIAVPSIMSTITESKKGTLASSAKLIASSAESMKISNDTLGVTEEIECTDVAQLTSEDYDTCKIDFINGDAYVSIIGKGKFEGMAVLSGTVEKAEAIRTTGLELTDDGNIRYTGSNPSNYIEFGNDNELWRIIGIFNVTTASGKTEKLMKIVRNESIGKYSWDSSASSVNGGNGVNQWGEVKDENGNIIYSGSDLKTELNELYLNSQSGRCFEGSNNADTICDFSTTGINDTYRSMIENVVWNIGAIEGESQIPALTAYTNERSTVKGNDLCASEDYCKDTVTRTTTWKGKVGLIYPSDYGYASRDMNCRANIYDADNAPCKNENWLNTVWYWTISPYTNTSSAYQVMRVNTTGFIFKVGSATAYAVRPALYLKSNVSIMSGDGSSSNPYKLSGN